MSNELDSQDKKVVEETSLDPSTAEPSEQVNQVNVEEKVEEKTQTNVSQPQRVGGKKTQVSLLEKAKDFFVKNKKLVMILGIVILLVVAITVTCVCVIPEKHTKHVDGNNDGYCDKCEEAMSNNNQNGGNDNGNANTGSKVKYTVKITNMAGVGMANVTVFIKDGSGAMADWLATDASGSGSRDLAPGTYYIELSPSNIPSGYKVDSKYYFNAERVANIVLMTEVVEGAHENYKVGSVMRDFTVATTTGGTFKLSEALKTHDAVLLNFFYTTCNPCITEFPYLDQAAGMYDDIAVIAVDTNGETLNDVELFQSTYDISNIEMGVHTIDLFAAFSSTGYPTSVMIDRYGVICLVEVGALPYLYPWTQMFDHFSADNYQQKLFASIDELTPQEKPNISQPASNEVAAVMNGNGLSGATYYPETEAVDAEYYWPFVISEKAGQTCMATSNPYKYGSVSAMHVDVTLQQNQALALDYICSTERGGDYFYILVNGEVIYTLSGADETPAWKTLYPYVATEDGTYKVSFVYNKDLDTDEGDDKVYIRNLSIVNASAIDVETYIPRNAVSVPTNLNREYQNYANVVYNEDDGYYHVNDVNGPLLLANLMNYVIDDETEERTSLWLYVLVNGFEIEGVDYAPRFTDYSSYASNSEIGGYCTVTEELKQMLEKMTAYYPGGVRDRTEKGWLRFCKYYDSYGTEKELDDPIAGLAPFSAYESVLNASVGLEEYPNAVTYKTIIIPRGKIFSFIPEVSGAYRILSNTNQEVDGWIFDEASFYAGAALYTADHYERLTDTNNDGVYTQIEYGSNNVCMVYYFEAGKEYFIDIAYYDTTMVGTVNFKIEYLGAEYAMFRYASPAPFTFYIDPETGNPPINDQTGQEEYITVAGGATPVLGNDGYYYVGESKIYVDFSLPIITGFMQKAILSHDYVDEDENPVHVAGILELGGFNFAEDEDGNAVSGGVDYSDRIEWYANNAMIESDGVYGSEASLAAGCVPVNEELAGILQKLVDKYSFSGIKNSWTKLCYYFDYLGAEENE